MLKRVRGAYSEFQGKHGHPIVMKMDLENGYGAVKIAGILATLYNAQRTRTIARHLYAAAGMPVTVFMREETMTYEPCMTNERSLMQGDILSPALFSMAIMPYLEEAREKLRKALRNEDIQFFAYIDDIVWILPDRPDSRTVALETVGECVRGVGSSIKSKKTLTLYPPGTRQLRTTEEFGAGGAYHQRTCEYIDILGTPFIGTTDGMTTAGRTSVQTYVKSRMMDGSRGQLHLKRLQRLRLPAWEPHASTGLTIIRKSILPSASYIIRNTPADMSVEAVRWFDTEVDSTVSALIRIKPTELSPSQRGVIALPTGFGGLGVHRLETMVGEMVRSAGSVAEKKESRQRIMAMHRRSYDSIVARLEEDKALENRPELSAAAAIMLQHLEDFDRSQRMTANTSSRYIFQADSVEAGPLLLRIYGMLGHIPKSRRGEAVQCAMCGKAIPLEHRLDHGARCERIGRAQRHDGVRDLVRNVAIYGHGMQNVKGEEGFHFANNTAAEPQQPPQDVNLQRSDFSFEAQAADDPGAKVKVRVDFGITVGGMRGRVAMEKHKATKYERIRQWATEDFRLVPAIMDTGGTMQPFCEKLLRYVSAHYQVGVMGTYSNARVEAFLGEVQARALEREYSMYLLTLGCESRDPAIAFDALLDSGASALIQPGRGEFTERKRRRELREEVAFVAAAREGRLTLSEEAYDSQGEA
jgi:hypothetical protein